VALGLLLAWTGDARAQQTGFAVNHYEPSERGSEWFAGESLDLRGHIRPAIGIVGDYAYRSLVIYDKNDNIQNSVVRNTFLLHAGGSVVLFERLRLGASIPLEVYGDGHTGTVSGVTFASPKNDQGIGDLRLSADARVLGSYGDVATLAVGAQVFLPTGQKEQYLGDGELRVKPRVMVAGDVGIFTYAAQAGFFYSGRGGKVNGSPLGSQLTLSGAAGVRVMDKKLVVGPEVWTSTVLDDGFGKLSTPVEGLFGAHYTIKEDWRAGAGVGTGFTRGYGAPQARALLSVEWTPGVKKDTDGDGIIDVEDACPTVNGVFTGDPKTNGCPLDSDHDGIYDKDDACIMVPGQKSEDPKQNGCPMDKDHDGVFDSDDACVDVPGVRTSDPKTNGCPTDRDHDGIYDKDDACIDVPGVRTSDPKTNGCPSDKDGDGVLDKDDACIDVPGLKTNDPKTNGCPNPDRDNDGVLNDVDACPDEAGKPDPDPKRNGCPKAFVKEGKIEILDQVKFKTSSAEILPGPESAEVLNAVLKVLTDHPEIKKLRVEGHTDDRGSAVLNKKLSADRAASVVKWLTAHGIDKARLASAGFGPDKPLADNKTEDGRKQNRRVEFHIEGGSDTVKEKK
jgi:outer membrane protein OmpA-like peptidoglycan-associated protein